MKGLKEGDKAILVKDFNPWLSYPESRLPKGTTLTIASDDSNDCYLVKEYNGNFDCDVLDKYKEFSPDAPADKPHKFKVGDRVRIIQGKNEEGLIWFTDFDKYVGDEDIILSHTSYGNYNLKSISYVFHPNWLELVTPTPFTNTIITDITSPEQHKRVQEKLFEMGHTKLMSGQTVDHIYISKEGRLSYWGGSRSNEAIEHCTSDYGKPKVVPASEFLTTERSFGVEEEPSPKTATEIIHQRDIDNMERMREISRLGLIGSTKIITKEEFDKLYNNNTPTPSPRTGDGIKKCMNNVCGGLEACANGIVDFAKNLVLSDDEKLLRKQGLHDQCGNSTFNAERLVVLKLIKDNEPYLLEIAKAKEAEDAKK